MRPIPCPLPGHTKFALHCCLAALLLPAVPASKAAPPSSAPATDRVELQTRLQVFLDNENFGPSKIDGRTGEFTRKALALYRQAHDLPATAAAQPEAQPEAQPDAPLDLTGLKLESVNPVFTTYTVTRDDIATTGEVPNTPEAQSKLKWLPYQSALEAVAEKFHCDIDFIKQLNPNKAADLKAGDELKVPNVKPFELAAVKTLQPGSAQDDLRAANDLEGDAAADGSAASKSAPAKEKEPTPNAGLSLYISTKDNMLQVLDDGKLRAAFPVTIGSEETHSPLGAWKVQRVAKLPNFRYDKKMLQHGERSADFHMLPPGPNNPVGIVWIALNKKGIGIHGTNDPDSIGRSASHGCIRLANWDALKLATMTKSGVPVKIE